MTNQEWLKNVKYNVILESFSLVSTNLMQNHWLVGKVNKWLWHAECQGPQLSPKSTYKDECLHGDLVANAPLSGLLRNQSFHFTAELPTL